MTPTNATPAIAANQPALSLKLISAAQDCPRGARPGTGRRVQRATGPRLEYRGKRLLDLVCVGVLSLPAALVSIICATAIRLNSAGPIIFRQQRAGRGGLPFTILSSAPWSMTTTRCTPDSTRITAVGRWLRRTSLDELPQLWNVARGDMSMVGPRPTLPYQVERYTAQQRGRLDVRPGITGLAQIRGRNEISWSDRIRFDLEYVAEQSFRLDVFIMLRPLSLLFAVKAPRGTIERTHCPLRGA